MFVATQDDQGGRANAPCDICHKPRPAVPPRNGLEPRDGLLGLHDPPARRPARQKRVTRGVHEDHN